MDEKDAPPPPRERRSHRDPFERDIHVNTSRLREIAPVVLGAGWQYRLAQRRGILLKTVQRWASGERIVPEEVIADLHVDAEAMAKSRELYDFREALDRLRESGLDPYIISALLTDQAAELKPVATAPSDKAYKRKAVEEPLKSDS